MNQKWTRTLLFAVLMILGANAAFADVYATIRGIITDPTGAVVSGAQITATNTQTGVSKTTTSQTNGLYEFLQLPIGTYRVDVTKDGFKTFKSSEFPLTVNQIYELTAKLEIGMANETVEVRTDSVQVETTSIQQQTLIGAQQIVDLPLNGRNFTQLEQLAPGVMASNDRFGTFSVNGSQSTQSNYLINGTDSNDIALNTPGFLPSPDAIQEFNLISSTINPEYGRNSGGIVNAVIKSGANQVHGSIFDFYRDTFMNTRNFFTVGPQQPIFHQNQFGGTVGGPVKKDKTFFFLSYQGTYNATATQNTVTVLSAAERAGDFSADRAQIKNAGTHTSAFPMFGDDGVLHPAGTPIAGTGVSGAIFNCGGPLTSACPNPNFGKIGTASFNPISLALINKFVPLPNTTANGFAFSPVNTSKSDQGIAKIDHNFNQSNQIWGLFADNYQRGTQGLPFTGATLPGFGSQQTASTKEITVAYNHTFSSNSLNELRLGYHRFNFDAVEPQSALNPADFGWTGLNIAPTPTSQLPVVSVGGLFTLGFSTNGPQPRKDTNYQVTDNFTKIMGRHSLKFGFDGRRFQVDNPFFADAYGAFNFSGTGRGSSGSSAADFLLGVPSSFVQGSDGLVINARAYEYYAYFQDQWKVKNNLTLTVGTGYQVDTPYHNTQFGGEAYNCIIAGQQSTVFPTAPVGLNFPGDKNCNNAGSTTKYGHFGPRLGFAYSPKWGGKITDAAANKTSIRGGVGIYFNRYEEETALQNLGAPPFGLFSSGSADVGGQASFAAPFTDVSNRAAGNIPNKFPFTPPALGSPVDFSFFEPMVLNTNDPNISTPYAINFNLNIQREFAAKTVVSLGYVGSLGRHLYRAYDTNFITAAGVAACKADPTCGNGGSGTSLQRLFFPDHSVLNSDAFGGIGTQFTDGTSNYNALQVNVTKGMTHGLSLITSYTWSHSIDNGSGFENSGFGTRGTNVLDPALNIGDSSQDARQRLSLGYIYQIPSLHQIMNWAPDKVFGGWKVTGITTFQTGFPVNIATTSFSSLSCDALTFYGCPDNPNQTAAVKTNMDPRSSSFISPLGGNVRNNYWFDPSSFSNVPTCTYTAGVLTNGNVCGQYGNSGRNTIHGPGINNFDMSLQKDTKVNERLNMQIGIEAFNLFNHTQFLAPNTNVNSTNFGRITSAAAGRIAQLRARFTF
jgi:hypothetical protein